MPEIQIYVLRVVMTCPIYSVSSYLALLYASEGGAYIEMFRDLYECFVLWSFLHLILGYCGGESDCIYLIENESRVKMPCPFCCISMARDARLMRFCKRGVLQFMFWKPLVSATSAIMLMTGYYYNRIFQTIVLVIYNFSYAWALYCLYVFYLATKIVIKDFKPVAKFAAVKSIIFATYYQALFLELGLSSPENANKWNDLLLCCEMVLFAIALTFAFPVKEFVGGIPDRRVLHNAKDLISMKDIYQDVYHNFMPAYHDYALQTSQAETPANDKLLSGTLGSNAAIEMTSRYRGPSKRNAFNTLLRGSRPIQATLRNHFDPMLAEDEKDEEGATNYLVMNCGGDSKIQSLSVGKIDGNPAIENATSQCKLSMHSDSRGTCEPGSTCADGDEKLLFDKKTLHSNSLKPFPMEKLLSRPPQPPQSLDRSFLRLDRSQDSDSFAMENTRSPLHMENPDNIKQSKKRNKTISEDAQERMLSPIVEWGEYSNA